MNSVIIISMVMGNLIAIAIGIILMKNYLDKIHLEVADIKTDLIEAVRGKGEAEGNLKAKIEQIKELKDTTTVKTEKIIVTTDSANVDANNVVVANK